MESDDSLHPGADQMTFEIPESPRGLRSILTGKSTRTVNQQRLTDAGTPAQRESNIRNRRDDRSNILSMSSGDLNQLADGYEASADMTLSTSTSRQQQKTVCTSHNRGSRTQSFQPRESTKVTTENGFQIQTCTTNHLTVSWASKLFLCDLASTCFGGGVDFSRESYSSIEDYTRSFIWIRGYSYCRTLIVVAQDNCQQLDWRATCCGYTTNDVMVF